MIDHGIACPRLILSLCFICESVKREKMTVSKIFLFNIMIWNFHFTRTAHSAPRRLGRYTHIGIPIRVYRQHFYSYREKLWTKVAWKAFRIGNQHATWWEFKHSQVQESLTIFTHIFLEKSNYPSFFSIYLQFCNAVCVTNTVMHIGEIEYTKTDVKKHARKQIWVWDRFNEAF
jgi:hypothetical protein